MISSRKLSFEERYPTWTTLTKRNRKIVSNDERYEPYERGNSVSLNMQYFHSEDSPTTSEVSVWTQESCRTSDPENFQFPFPTCGSSLPSDFSLSVQSTAHWRRKERQSLLSAQRTIHKWRPVLRGEPKCRCSLWGCVNTESETQTRRRRVQNVWKLF